MKAKKMFKKLELNKDTIANLNWRDMGAVMGGHDHEDDEDASDIPEYCESPWETYRRGRLRHL